MLLILDRWGDIPNGGTTIGYCHSKYAGCWTVTAAEHFEFLEGIRCAVAGPYDLEQASGGTDPWCVSRGGQARSKACKFGTASRIQALVKRLGDDKSVVANKVGGPVACSRGL